MRQETVKDRRAPAQAEGELTCLVLVHQARARLEADFPEVDYPETGSPEDYRAAGFPVLAVREQAYPDLAAAALDRVDSLPAVQAPAELAQVQARVECRRRWANHPEWAAPPEIHARPELDREAKVDLAALVLALEALLV